MTAPGSTPVSGIDLTKYLPTTLPSAEEIRSAGRTFDAKGTTIDTTYSNTTAHWNKLATAATYPSDETVNNGFVKEILPIAEAVVIGINDVKSATDAFADSIEGFETRHSNLKSDVEGFNSLPTTPHTDSEQAAAQAAGETLPTTRTIAERQRITGLLETAKNDYEGYVDTCVDAIRAASPAGVDPIADKIATGGKALTAFKNSYNMVNTNVDRLADLKVNDRGRIKFSWDLNEKSLSEFAFDGNPTLKKYLVEGKLGGDPDGFFQTNRKALIKWADNRYLKFTDNVKVWGDVTARPGLMMMLPAAVRDRLSNTLGRNRGGFATQNNRRFNWKSNSHGRTKFDGYLTGHRKPGRADKALKKFDKASKGLKKLGNSRLGKLAGPAAGILDVGMTYSDSYSRNFEEAQRNDPNASMADLRKESGISAGFEGTAETAGKIAGGVAGRALGAAAGQALIPIPGVGAAVGGFVGGLAGEWVGGKIGKGVGEFINDWRQGGATKALGDTAEAVENIGEDIGNTAKEVGSVALKGVGKVFGWG